ALYTADYRFKDIDRPGTGVPGVSFQYQYLGGDNWRTEDWNSKYWRTQDDKATMAILGKVHEFENGDEFVFTKVKDDLLLTLVRESPRSAIGLEDGKEPASLRGMPCANVGEADTILPKDGKVTQAELNDLLEDSELLAQLKAQFKWDGTQPGTTTTEVTDGGAESAGPGTDEGAGSTDTGTGEDSPTGGGSTTSGGATLEDCGGCECYAGTGKCACSFCSGQFAAQRSGKSCKDKKDGTIYLCESKAVDAEWKTTGLLCDNNLGYGGAFSDGDSGGSCFLISDEETSTAKGWLLTDIQNYNDYDAIYYSCCDGNNLKFLSPVWDNYAVKKGSTTASGLEQVSLEDSDYLAMASGTTQTYTVNDNEFCESGLACVLARVNDRLQPEYENAYLTCVEPESRDYDDSCNLVRIPQAIFDNENWGITECLGENKQCREDYAAYASDDAYRCGPQWINLYRLAEPCGATPVYVAAEEGTKIEGAQPEYRVLMPGDKTPEEALLEPEKEALARLTEIAREEEAGAPTTFVLKTETKKGEKKIVVAPRAVAASASKQGPGTSAPEGEPELIELVELVALTQFPKSPVSQGFCPPEPLFEGEADRLPAVAAIHEEAREGLTEAVKNPTPVQYDDEPAKIAEALGVSEDELAKVNVMTKEGKSVTVGADKVTKLEQLLKAFKELPKPQMIQEVLDEGVIAYYQEKPGPDWKTVELVAEKQLEAERVREEEAEKERAEAERLAEEKRIAEQSDRDARLYALQHPVGTVTFQYALASESLGGYIIDFQKEILLLLADVDGNSQIDEGEPTITVSKLRVRTGLGGVASAPTTNRGFAELGKADTYEQFKGSVESKSGVQGLLLSDVTEEKKQELLLKTFKDVYVCYDFGDLIGWRAVKLVYEEEGEPQ
ncbi:hypothetical protein COU38_02470, partial [Candidatus Micrarchaeota archaeon CG10_big_fil_rev_8_21_14_0_10_54_18]